MRRLILLRHAKTETDAPSGRDFDRRLDARGHSDAAEIGHWLASQDQVPARVLVSPAMRARQTCNIVAPLLPRPPDIVEDEQLYNAAPAEIMASIREHGGDASSLMVVAHNPGLHELGLALTGDGNGSAQRALGDNLPTSGLVIIDFDGTAWSEAGFRRGHLVDFISPKTLRNAAQETR